METIYPTLGDDDCVIVAETGSVEPMHPGYVGDKHVLAAPMLMSPDGLCLYHCIVAAMDVSTYSALSEAERVTKAESLRMATIAELREHGLSEQASRLGLSGYDGYPDS